MNNRILAENANPSLDFSYKANMFSFLLALIVFTLIFIFQNSSLAEKTLLLNIYR
jgi:hypothetical protein